MDRSLIGKVAEQMGYSEVTDPDFVQTCEDIAEHGAGAGWGGFTYYSDTCKFFEDNTRVIMAMARELAREFGQGMTEFLASFPCLKACDITAEDVDMWRDDVAGKDESVLIENALSWFALEEVARYVADNPREFEAEETEET